MTLATRDIATAISPAEFRAGLEAAKQKALILREMVQAQGLAVKVGVSEHLKLEGWQTIGRAYGCSGRTHVAELLRDANGTIEGVQAHADIVDSQGVIVGGADSFCFANEDGKEEQTIAQLAGMAQTRAEGRAFKQMFSWVVVLADYSATPAEEVTGAVSRRKEQEADPRFLCPKHQTNWFKSKKMRRYAHPIGETGQWCEMPEAPASPDAEDGPQESTKGPPGAAPVAQAQPPPFEGSTLIELWNWAIHWFPWAYKSKADCLAALNVQDEALITDLKAAAATLAAKAQAKAAARKGGVSQ